LEKNIELSDTELAFQLDPTNWRYGPIFAVRFHFAHALNFADFQTALLNDPLCRTDPRFDIPSRVLLRHAHWSNCVGASYYGFERPGRREPSITFSPRQYRTVLGKMNFTCGRDGTLSTFLGPIISLAQRIKTECDANEVLLFTEDFYPSKEPETEISKGVFLAKPIFQALR
jgi:hypothetical protein